jgi:hypothetical protein
MAEPSGDETVSQLGQHVLALDVRRAQPGTVRVALTRRLRGPLPVRILVTCPPGHGRSIAGLARADKSPSAAGIQQKLLPPTRRRGYDEVG